MAAFVHHLLDAIRHRGRDRGGCAALFWRHHFDRAFRDQDLVKSSLTNRRQCRGLNLAAAMWLRSSKGQKRGLGFDGSRHGVTDLIRFGIKEAPRMGKPLFSFLW